MLDQALLHTLDITFLDLEHQNASTASRIHRNAVVFGMNRFINLILVVFYYFFHFKKNSYFVELLQLGRKLLFLITLNSFLDINQATFPSSFH